MPNPTEPIKQAAKTLGWQEEEKQAKPEVAPNQSKDDNVSWLKGTRAWIAGAAGTPLFLALLKYFLSKRSTEHKLASESKALLSRATEERLRVFRNNIEAISANIRNIEQNEGRQRSVVMREAFVKSKPRVAEACIAVAGDIPNNHWETFERARDTYAKLSESDLEVIEARAFAYHSGITTLATGEREPRGFSDAVETVLGLLEEMRGSAISKS